MSARRKNPPCPTPRKQKFKTEAAADAAMGLFWRTAGRGKAMPCRVYRCVCGGWHTTSKPKLSARGCA